MVQDLVHNLCESLVENIGGVAGVGKKKPTPITYLTQWKIVGNSEVHTDPYLTSWKVSGNSVVDNNTILSCGDLGQDGKYHVKISNGVDIYDIALNEPLRKVNDVSDSIEFPSDTEGKALVTRPLKSVNLYDCINSMSRSITGKTSTDGIYAYSLSLFLDVLPPPNNSTSINGLCSAYIVGTRSNTYNCQKRCISITYEKYCHVYDPDFDGADDIDAFKAYITEVKPEFIYELAAPTTELVDAPQIAVSPTDTYTSANATPYSAFEHTENKEIWSCGEYNATDGKYHILVKPEGGSIADIVLNEPLRKIDNTADTLEYPTETSGKALLTIRVEESGGELSPLTTPTTELVDAPQIEEAESYSCVISQGGKAVEWSSFNCGILYFYDKIIPTGNAYIDTGYIPSIDSKFVTHIKRISLNQGCLYSNASSNKIDGIRFLLSGNRYYVSFGASRVLNEPNTDLDLTITHAHTEYLIINGNDNTYKTSVGNNYIAEPLTIFSDYYNRSISGAMAYFNGNSLYSFKIYENDVLVRDFKPCTYNGVAGLWDMVESKFYGNSNSVGTLTASNDV